MAKKKDLFDEEAISLPVGTFDEQFQKQVSSTPLEDLNIYNQGVAPLTQAGERFESESIYDPGIPFEQTFATDGIGERRAEQQGTAATLGAVYLVEDYLSYLRLVQDSDM